MKIECAAAPALEAIATVYAPFLQRRRQAVHFACSIEPAPRDRGFVYRHKSFRRLAPTLADLLFLFDKELTIALQRQRRDLYFVHAGVVGFRRSAVAFVAPSGTGKSTTVWALLQAGFKYVSDELLPIDLETARIWPYPRALCLKMLPAASYVWPRKTIDGGTRHYVPTAARAAARTDGLLPLRAIFFLERAQPEAEARAVPVGAAEAGARLYANTLNPLAHPRLGLDAALLVAHRARCFQLHLGALPATVAAVQAALREE